MSYRRSPAGPIPDDYPRSLEEVAPAILGLMIATPIGMVLWGLLWLLLDLLVS